MTPHQSLELFASYPLLKFGSNWNNKLYTGRYTTIRIWKAVKLDQLYHAVLKDKSGNVEVKTKSGKLEHYLSMGLHHCISAYPTTLGNLREHECYTDTGYSLKDTKDIICKMYANLYQAHGDNLRLGIYVMDQTNLVLGTITPDEKVNEQCHFPADPAFAKMIYNLCQDTPTVTVTIQPTDITTEMQAVGEINNKAK